MTPTGAELQTELNAGAERLRQTRIAAAGGTATVDDLHEAEKAYRYAETRISAAVEAAKSMQHELRRQRARKLVAELQNLHDGEGAALSKMEAKGCELLADYLDRAGHFWIEHRVIHGELVSIRDLDRAALPYGVRVNRHGQNIGIDGRNYGQRAGSASADRRWAGSRCRVSQSTRQDRPGALVPAPPMSRHLRAAIVA